LSRHEGAAYHPQSQGTVERTNGRAVSLLRAFLRGSDERWEAYVTLAAWVLNTRAMVPLGGLSPFALVYGHQPHSPMDYAIPLPPRPGGNRDDVEPVVYLARLRTTISQMRRRAAADEARYCRNQQAALERRVPGRGANVVYQPGDVVAICAHPQPGQRVNKLTHPWRAPFEVVAPSARHPALPGRVWTVRACRRGEGLEVGQAIDVHASRMVPFDLSRVVETLGDPRCAQEGTAGPEVRWRDPLLPLVWTEIARLPGYRAALVPHQLRAHRFSLTADGRRELELEVVWAGFGHDGPATTWETGSAVWSYAPDLLMTYCESEGLGPVAYPDRRLPLWLRQGCPDATTSDEEEADEAAGSS
jgi:hypothetical protein